MEGIRRRLTLSEQMSILDSSNLRDLLRVRDDDIDDGRNALAGLTLGAVLGCEEIIRPNNNNNHHQPSRTLLDIIKDEESGAAYRGINVVVDNTHDGINNNNKQKSWKSFKDRLRLRRAGAAWSSSSSSSHHHHHPVSDDCDDDDCRLEISGPTLTGIQRSSFSLVPSRSSVPVQNVIDFDGREISTVEEAEGEINTGTGGSSSDVITVPNNSAPSEPVVMRLSAVLAAEREEQRQQASQLEDERESTETQLVEERESTVQVPEQQEEGHRDHHQQLQNQSRNEELGINQRGVGIVSAGQQQSNQSRNEELGINQRGTGVVSTGQHQQQNQSRNEELGIDQRGAGIVSTGQQQQQNQSRNEELGIDQRGVGVVATGQQQPLRVSLMALLEETMDHRQNELILLDEEEEEMVGGGGVEEDQVVGMMIERERGKNDEYICCVCMVRHKGAAFIPCGHTFCRLCSRKLWVNRGNCPLCNGFILEILDIF